jgi:hypothetical protein
MILYSKEAFIGYFFDSLGLTSEDLIILDRSTGLAQALLNHKGAAKLACVIHAEHYNVNATDDDYILWNNFYDYEFSHADAFDAFIASTDQQNQTLSQQFKKYTKFSPNIQTIPVSKIDESYNTDKSPDILNGRDESNDYKNDRRGYLQDIPSESSSMYNSTRVKNYFIIIHFIFYREM